MLDAFVGAYDTPTNGLVDGADLTVATLSFGRVDARIVGAMVPVHHSSQPEWDFSGSVLHDGSATVASWPSRHAQVRLGPGTLDVTVDVERTTEAAAGETFFHACRSLALYARSPSIGALAHASVFAGGRGAVAACGRARAGKTTLLLRAVLDLGYQPVTNDRALITWSEPRVASFPGYFTAREGTLAADPRLTEAVRRFEDPANPLRTTPRSVDLVRDFIGRKRRYPMGFLREVAGRPYAHVAPLRALLLPEIDYGRGSACSIEQLDVASINGRADVLRTLEANVFEGPDPSFLPWHDLPWPVLPGTAARLAHVLADNQIPVFRVRAGPAGLRPVDDLLAQLIG